MSRWFRHYAGMMRDEKLVAVAVRAKQPVERVVWVWGAILESAAEIDDGGRFAFDSAEAAYFLRADEADVVSILDGLANAGRVDQCVVVNWNDRQFQSDKSVARQAAYRERKRQKAVGCDVQKFGSDGQVTENDGQVTSQETETETETEAERENARAQGHREVAGEILKDKTFALSPWEDGFLANIAQVKRLSAEQKAQFEAISGRWKGKQANAPPIVPKVPVAEGSPEMASWEAGGKRYPRTDVRMEDGRLARGWYFPSKLPPPTQEQAA